MFAAEAASLVVTGQDFCIARVCKDDDKKQHRIDFALFWSWSDQTQEIEKGFDDAIYDEVEQYGEGYYIFSTQCEPEYMVEEDDGVWRRCGYTMPKEFYKWCSFDEIENTEELTI
jgi:hypothetical protein